MASVRKTHSKSYGTKPHSQNYVYATKATKTHDTRSKRRKVEVAAGEAKEDDEVQAQVQAQAGPHTYRVTGCSIPGHYQRKFTVGTYYSATRNIISVEDQDITSSYFTLAIHLNKIFSEPQHALEDGEKEVLCLMGWLKPGDKPGDTREHHEGRAAIYASGHIRCDSMSCLPFWMELTPTELV
jgi:hypothetical protein